MRKSARKGFTLVELLVVLGIILLLLGLLLPSLRRVREAGRDLSCLSNLRQVGIGVQNYTAQNKGIVMPGEYRDSNSSEAWASILVRLKLVPAPDQGSDAITSDSTSRGNSVFRCPNGDDRNINDEGGRASEVFFYNDFYRGFRRVARYVSNVQQGQSLDIWYAFNGATFRTEYSGNRVPQDGGSNYNIQKSMSQIRLPSETVFFYDGFWMHNDVSRRINARHYSGITRDVDFGNGPVQVRDTAINCVMVDGSVKSADTSKWPLAGLPRNEIHAVSITQGISWRAD